MKKQSSIFEKSFVYTSKIVSATILFTPPAIGYRSGTEVKVTPEKWYICKEISDDKLECSDDGLYAEVLDNSLVTALKKEVENKPLHFSFLPDIPKNDILISDEHSNFYLVDLKILVSYRVYNSGPKGAKEALKGLYEDGYNLIMDHLGNAYKIPTKVLGTLKVAEDALPDLIKDYKLQPGSTGVYMRTAANPSDTHSWY